MGLTKGTGIKIIRCAPLGGPVIISVRGTNLVIGAGMANKIYVETIDDYSIGY
jgi:Fe2+ transport system protein FeoA